MDKPIIPRQSMPSELRRYERRIKQLRLPLEDFQGDFLLTKRERARAQAEKKAQEPR